MPYDEQHQGKQKPQKPAKPQRPMSEERRHQLYTKLARDSLDRGHNRGE